MQLGTVRVPILRGLGIAHLAEHEPWLTPLLRTLLSHRSGAFVDVGVNIGQTLMKVLKCDPTREYYGFEPNPVCYDYVRRLKEISNLEHVYLVPVGLSDRTHLGQLFGNSLTDPGATTTRGFRGTEKDENGQLVPLCKGEDLLPGLLDVAVVKIDVEGGELEVIRGLYETLRRCRPFVLCEVLPIYDELGLVAMLYLGPRQDGAPFTNEDMDLAHACGQRILDTLGDHEAMQAVAGLLRRRIVDVKLLGAQQRRVLHDEILPQMHLALLRLETLRSHGDATALDEAVGMISDAHRCLAA